MPGEHVRTAQPILGVSILGSLGFMRVQLFLMGSTSAGCMCWVLLIS